LRAAEVSIHPLAGWQLFVHRGGSWTNPQSSAAVNTPSGNTAASAPARMPEGVRLVLEVPPVSPVAGRLTLDWVRPTLSGSGS
jgi:general secretion pathway protein J